MIVFTHVPKTAGSTFMAGVSAMQGRLRVMTRPDYAESELPLDEQEVDLLGGHVRFGAAQARYPGAYFVAAVRDVVERLVSHYFFAVRNGDFPRSSEADGPVAGFRRFYDWEMKSGGGRNLQCRFLSETTDAAATIATIESRFAMVWDQASFAAAWPIAAALVRDRAHQRPPPLRLSRLHLDAATPILEDVYVAPRSAEGSVDGVAPTDYHAFVPPDLIERIEAENAEDRALTAWVRAQGGLFVNPRKILLEN